MKILMVCLGNICRSPLAQGILENKVKDYITEWEIDSAGTGGWHAGEKPDLRSIQIANKNNIDISAQRARKIRSIDFEYYDWIFAMDQSNLNDLRKQAHEHELDKIVKLTHFSKKYNLHDIPDPYYGEGDGFQIVYDMLSESIDCFLDHLNK
jgi:protein-tyrosine phosphatase